MITMKTVRSTPVAVVLTLTGCAQVTYPELDGSGMAIRVEGNDGEVGEWRCAESDMSVTRRRCVDTDRDSLFASCDQPTEVAFPQRNRDPTAGLRVASDGRLGGRWRFSGSPAQVNLVGHLDEDTREGGWVTITLTDDGDAGRVSARGWARTDDLTVTVVADFALPPADDCTPDDFE